MTPAETTRVLALAQALDPRLTISQETLAAWHSIAGHLGFEQACANVQDHYRSESRALMPVDLLGGKQTPTPGAALPLPPVDPDDVGRYQGWLRAYGRALIHGNPSDNAEALADEALGIIRRPQIRHHRPLSLPSLPTP